MLAGPGLLHKRFIDSFSSWPLLLVWLFRFGLTQSELMSPTVICIVWLNIQKSIDIPNSRWLAVIFLGIAWVIFFSSLKLVIMVVCRWFLFFFHCKCLTGMSLLIWFPSIFIFLLHLLLLNNNHFTVFTLGRTLT